MKVLFNVLLFLALVGIFFVPTQQIQAQTPTLHDTVSYVSGDTMYVAWAHTNWTPRINALRSAIVGDTVAGGGRASLTRVYYLKMDGYYWEADDIANSGFPLTIVGPPMSSLPTGHYPPIIQMADQREDGSTGANHILTAGDDVTLRNVWVTGRLTSSGAQTSYQPVLFNANNSTYIIDGCIFEYSNFSLVVFTGANNKCYITNNKFQNLQEKPVTQQWTGRGVSIWADQDTVVMENNTFFNLGFATFQMEGGSASYLRFNHNTIVGLGRGIMSGSGDWWQNAYFANNLIINGWWEGEGYQDMHGSGRDPRAKFGGLFTIGILPASYGPEQSRRIVISKNYAYLDPAIEAKYGTPDSIVRAWFIDPVSVLDYAAPYAVGGANNGHMYVGDTTWLTALPTGFTNYLQDADWQKPLNNVTGATMVDSMWKFITNIRNGVTGGTTLFYHPTTHYTDQSWPLPYNFVYTDNTLMTAGTDGLPIGDLNWFPTQKATFLANQAANVATIESKAGAVVHFPVDSTAEAEFATLGGTATVDKFAGFSYFYMQSGGYIQWDFNLTTAGQYGLNILTHLRGNDMRGENFYINDPVAPYNHSAYAIHDVIGWGELEFCSTQHSHTASEWRGPFMNLDDNSWQWAYFPKDSILAADQSKLNFVAGANRIKITPSWGYQNFSEVDLIKPGATVTFGQKAAAADIVIELKAPDATSSVVTPMGEGAPWVPSLFKSVAMGTAGTITLNLTASSAGTYHMRIFGLNKASTAATLTLAEGSTTLCTAALPAVKPDTSGVDVFSGGFTLTSGAHAITISGANVNIDYVQLIKEVVGAVGQVGPPSAYALDQNFPNPFNPSTTINFSLGQVSNVKLKVYNLLGQEVMTLIDSRMNPGSHSVVFDAGKLSSGVYFYRLEAGTFKSVKKMLLIK